MDEERFEKMAEMMKGYCKDEESMANCCAMMKRMMRYGKEKEEARKKKDTGETE